MGDNPEGIQDINSPAAPAVKTNAELFKEELDALFAKYPDVVIDVEHRLVAKILAPKTE